ncbi:MAG: hypothetical protein M1380_05695 [Chloroflexi bacterium]|nr:hypothetical protein [Chloroflexota bacterium]
MTWTALDADTKLVVSWLVRSRDADTANAFMQDIADRLTGRAQLTTDGHHRYLETIDGAFGCNIDYAMPLKTMVAILRATAAIADQSA